MGRPSKAKIAELTGLFYWLKAGEYTCKLKDTSDLDLIRALYDRANMFRRTDDSVVVSFFEKIINGELISSQPMHDQFFQKRAANDYGFLEQSKEVGDPKYIEPLSANHVFSLYFSLPYAEDFLENQRVRREWYAYTYDGLFENQACLNLNLSATDAEILSELQLLLPKLRKVYRKPPALKQINSYLEKIRTKNILALCDFMIFWKLKNLGELLKPIVCSVIYGDTRTPDDIKENELALARSILEGDLSELILLGRSLQQ
jgi:hypothetical protein